MKKNFNLFISCFVSILNLKKKTKILKNILKKHFKKTLITIIISIYANTDYLKHH